ncbi:MAG: ATP-binding protein [Nitrospirae bacterium]|uniref:sensor histidine kinase n=1 Tax=Candidatus Magnetominusculus dajiuhuensis TaxID=3137712 RepID=UPI001A0CAD33|nr:ATP-binding protein [Nitrospirota bacterium]
MKNTRTIESGRHNTAVSPSSITSPLRYLRLKISIVILLVTISIVFLLIVLFVSNFWLQRFLNEETQNQTRWQMENTKNSIEFFINLKVSALRFLASGYQFDQLLDQKVLYYLFSNFKKDFGDAVDLGVIDSMGIMRSYAGPYNLKGKNYSDQGWFKQVEVQDSCVSEVFMGYRGNPHFAVAVKTAIPETNGFWILRATVDIKTLQWLISTFNLNVNDDAFIVTPKGILQTPSRFHGDVLKYSDIKMPYLQHGVNVSEQELPNGTPFIYAYAYIKDSPWILSAIIKSRAQTPTAKSFLNQLIAIFVISILIIIVITVKMAHSMVNWIRDADEKRQEALSEIEHSGKLASIGRLAAGVAHEINNPLSIIGQRAGLIKDILEMAEGREDFKSMIDDMKNRDKFIGLTNGILDAVTRCRTITHRLLGFARRMDTAYELIDLNETLLEVLSFLDKEILFRDIKLVRNLDPDLPQIKTDKGQVQQVFLNIINNAVDAVAREGVIELSTKKKDSQTVAVFISDNGQGIPKSRVKHIFEPFYTTKEKDKGTGLGLFISYGIIRKLGGSIAVESEIDNGTTFIIELPLFSNEEESNAAG